MNRLLSRSLLAVLTFSVALFAIFSFASAATPRIVWGQPASMKEWPFIVSVVSRDEASSFQGHICGGSSVAPGWVLTAGHCLVEEHLDVVYGRKDIRTNTGQRLAASRSYLHPLYKEIKGTPRYDFALLQIAGLPSYENTIPMARSTKAPRSFLAAGWGETWSSPRARAIEVYPMGPSPLLREVRLSKSSHSTCRKLFQEFYHSKTMICVGGNKKRDVCHGDSGGPLVRKGVLWGITSFGSDCGGKPSVFASVASAHKWIVDTINKEHVSD